jgi:hypothetical protein
MASNLSHTHLPSRIASFSIFGYFAETVVTDATNKKCKYARIAFLFGAIFTSLIIQLNGVLLRYFHDNSAFGSGLENLFISLE